MSIESVMPSNHLILCYPLLLPSIFPTFRVFSNESALHIRWLILELVSTNSNTVKSWITGKTSSSARCLNGLHVWLAFSVMHPSPLILVDSHLALLLIIFPGLRLLSSWSLIISSISSRVLDKTPAFWAPLSRASLAQQDMAKPSWRNAAFQRNAVVDEILTSPSGPRPLLLQLPGMLTVEGSQLQQLPLTK